MNNFKEMKLGTIIGKKVRFVWNQIKGFIHKIPKLISLITSCNVASGKLLIPILSTVEKTVLNAEKFFGLYHKLLKPNQSGMKKNLVRQPKEWKKMNNLKQIYTSN
ncbi:DUF6493 family protein [Chryseobacterium sp. S0630]|uniref:DUF6493 family protein n=1 Tax=unclassified Chryseobacterium TaxID=2593645 RepID=UPI0012E07F21|nr:DUF6493 family protein [Chryseobacterium sp. S0630]MCP1298177.1 DUF6493 family protein [Chryseobacterium sp. S0630]